MRLTVGRMWRRESHTVTVTHTRMGRAYFYFDFLEIAVADDGSAGVRRGCRPPRWQRTGTPTIRSRWRRSGRRG